MIMNKNETIHFPKNARDVIIQLLKTADDFKKTNKDSTIATLEEAIKVMAAELIERDKTVIALMTSIQRLRKEFNIKNNRMTS